MQIPVEQQNSVEYLMNMTLKRENDEFLVITLKHVSGLRIVVNPPRAPKLCAIAHGNGHKT